MVLVVGESLVDELPAPGGDHRLVAGGSPANVARGLARLGRHVLLRTSIGDDDAGRMLVSSLAADGVKIAAGSHRTGPTSRAVATLDEDGRASYDLQVRWDPGEIEIPEAISWMHTGSLATVAPPGHVAVAAAVAAAAARELPISLDLNSRQPLPASPEQTLAWLDRLMRAATVVKASDDDLALLAPGQPWRDVARRWVDHGRTAFVVVTLGDHGAWVGASRAAGSFEVLVPSPHVTVVDTVGAGDTFMAALIDGLLDCGPLTLSERTPVTLTPNQLEAVLTRACVAAAICCEREGANPPTEAELDARERLLA